jgi:arginyl-tRNA synthetase
MVIEKVRDLINNTLEKENLVPLSFSLERNYRPSLGDFSTNLPRLLIKKQKKSVDVLSKELEKSPLIDRVEEKNGFLNVFIRPNVWEEELGKILRGAHLKDIVSTEQKKVNVEFISANPTGELHVGNGRGAFFGDALSNVLEKTGHKVEREYFVNDAKTSLQIQALGNTALGRGEAYETEYLRSLLRELEPALKGIEDPSEAGFIVARRVAEDIKEFVTSTLRIKIDRWFSENDLYETRAVEHTTQKLPTYEKDGALWVRTSEYGDEEDRVVVRSTGDPTYFLSDIAYHLEKASRADSLIDIWGADHQGHVIRMMAVARALGFDAKLTILISQIVSLKESGEARRMSKRKGDLVSLKWLIEEVGLDATRFFYLSKTLSTHMEFDVALAKERSQKNPVYYVQYSYARSHQIFEKAGSTSIFTEVDLSVLKEPNEQMLMKQLTELPELLVRISKTYEVHRLTNYALELSRSFHKFYETSHVLVEDEALRNARLCLVKAYQTVLNDTLSLLGISAPEKM